MYTLPKDKHSPRGKEDKAMTTKTTKAQRIYHSTRYDCKEHIKHWGFEGIGFNRLSYRDDESISTRTLNAVEKELERAEKNLRIDRELGVGTDEQNSLEEQVLRMVRITLENNRRSYEEWARA